MSSPLIALDMDGVLADFVGSALPLFGDYIETTFWDGKEGEYDMANLLRVSIKDFWIKIDRKPYFWDDLQLYSNANELVDLCVESVGKENVYILSSPCMNEHCYAGKYRWIDRHFKSFRTRFILCNHKYHFASPNKFLIDDSDSKIDKFRKYGGEGFLYPRPWNRKHRSSLQNSHIELKETIREWRETFDAKEKAS